jgi:hypothetical protein
MLFIVNCETFNADGPTREETLFVVASDRMAAINEARRAVKRWPESAALKAGILITGPRPVFLSVGHCARELLAADLAYLIGYMVADGDDAMELDYASGYIACALYGGADCDVDWMATDEIIKPRVAAMMRAAAAARRADLVPEGLVS